MQISKVSGIEMTMQRFAPNYSNWGEVKLCYKGPFYACAYTVSYTVTLWRRLSLSGRIENIVPGYQRQCYDTIYLEDIQSALFRRDGNNQNLMK